MLFKGKKVFEENVNEADNFRNNYTNGIEKYIEKLNCFGAEEREKYMPWEGFDKNIENYRTEYIKMLGIYKIKEEKCPPAEKIYVGEDEISTIYRIIVYITPEIPFYGMLFVPHKAKKDAPLVIVQHGGGGTPELCMDLNGKNNYNHLGQRILEKGAVVFAPQLLLWRFDNGIETAPARDAKYNREVINNNLKRFGLSITALEIKGIMKSLDYLEEKVEFDKEKIGMTGLSYGGYYTLYTMAAEKRIKAGYTNACYNDRDAYPWHDMTYHNSGILFQDAEVAALCAPRKLFVSVGKADPVFNYQSAEKIGENPKKYYKAFEAEENYKFSLWEGGHTVDDDDKGIDFMFSAF